MRGLCIAHRSRTYLDMVPGKDIQAVPQRRGRVCAEYRRQRVHGNQGGPRGGLWWGLLAVCNVHWTLLSLVTELFELERGPEPTTQDNVPASLAARMSS